MIKLIYRPVSLLVSVLGGMLAGAIFKQIWKLAAREDDAPKATDAQRGWREILPAAALRRNFQQAMDLLLGRRHPAPVLGVGLIPVRGGAVRPDRGGRA
jgi:hypothetical protein